MTNDSKESVKWWVKLMLGIAGTACAAIISVLWTDRTVMETRLRNVEIKVGKQQSFQSEVLRRLERIEKKLDTIGPETKEDK